MKKTAAIIYLALIFLAGCEKNVDVDLPKEAPKIVVNSFFTPDSLVKVQVSLSKSVLERPVINGIENAEVKLFEEGQELETLKRDSGQKFVYYSSEKIIKPEKKYSIIVSAPKYESAAAQSWVPLPVQIGSATINSSAGIDIDGSPFNSVRLQLSDPVDAENYYAIKVRWLDYQVTKNEGENDTLWKTSFANLFPEPTLSGLRAENQLLFSDKQFNGNTVDLLAYFYPGLNTGFKRKGYTVFLISSGKEFYEYYRRLPEHLGNQSFEILGGETVPMPNNINNGYGIFAGYSWDEISLTE